MQAKNKIQFLTDQVKFDTFSCLNAKLHDLYGWESGKMYQNYRCIYINSYCIHN